eukprot:scaffold1058_cov155-Ochromonas_danica.AAC.20
MDSKGQVGRSTVDWSSRSSRRCGRCEGEGGCGGVSSPLFWVVEAIQGTFSHRLLLCGVWGGGCAPIRELDLEFCMASPRK